MTARQRAFCLAYIACPDAARAARAAGYAPTVAATNAARILSAPPVQAWLERQRRRRCLVTLQDLQLQADRCRQILQDPTATCKDYFRASAELRQIARSAQKLPPEAQDLSPQDEAELAAAFAQGPTSPDKNGLQMIEDEAVDKNQKSDKSPNNTTNNPALLPELPEPAPAILGTTALRQDFARISIDHHRNECRRIKEENLKANLELKTRYLNHLQGAPTIRLPR